MVRQLKDQSFLKSTIAYLICSCTENKVLVLVLEGTVLDTCPQILHLNAWHDQSIEIFPS